MIENREGATDTPTPYDLIASEWRAAQRRFTAQPFLDMMIPMLPANAEILDLGCGNGLPNAAHLIAHGFRVTGVDESMRQIASAAEDLPEMRGVVGDMRSVSFGREFDAVVAWDSTFHLARVEQRAMIARCAAWLRPGGLLLISHGGTAGDISGEMFGVTFFYSADAPEEFVRTIEANGFRIIHHEMDEPPVIEAGGYGHCVTLAGKGRREKGNGKKGSGIRDQSARLLNDRIDISGSRKKRS